MNENDNAVPPPEPLPQGPSQPVPPVAPPQYGPPVVPPVTPPQYGPPAAPPVTPPQYGPPVLPAPPVALNPSTSPRSGRKTAIVVSSIAIGAAVIIGLATWGIVSLITGVTSVVEEAAPHPIEPLLTGTPGPTTAVDPTACPETCFTFRDIEGTIAEPAELDTLGLTETIESWGDYSSSTVLAEFTANADYWKQDGGTPDACFVVYPASPIAVPIGSVVDHSDGTIDFSGTYGQRFGASTLTQSVRQFDTSDLAVSHMAAVGEQLDACDHYSLDSGWVASVSRAPAISLPNSVGAVGWVEDSAAGRFYAFDLQRGNMVVRTQVYTDGSLTEGEYRDFIEAAARQLAELDPGQYPSESSATGCEQRCLTEESVALLRPAADALAALGALPAIAAPAVASTSQSAWDESHAAFVTAGGSPAVCSFTNSIVPIGTSANMYASGDEPVVMLGAFGDGASTLTQTARLFESELYASRHPASLRSPIIQCAEFTDGTTAWTVEPLELSTSPAGTVTVAGWSQTSDAGSRLVADLQYRNVTMRIALDRSAGSTVTDAQFASYVLEVSRQLAAQH